MELDDDYYNQTLQLISQISTILIIRIITPFQCLQQRQLKQLNYTQQ